ncbi:MAG: hypothetical protein C0592_07735 [Marinilabiliales bacterium]|nr:MAG: hypothetical protein C0592_07735 [Marinilabiliales bacterium]
MKRLFAAIFILTLLSATLQAQKKQARLLVYDFHNTIRCHTCATIEETMIELLNTHYKEQLDSGIIVFKSFDCQAEENAELVKKYSAYGSTLVFTAFDNDGNEIINDVTDIAFSKIGKKELFYEKMRKEIDEMLEL